jgi:two-component system, OmpR family, sensor histidine kinase SenX3
LLRKRKPEAQLTAVDAFESVAAQVVDVIASAGLVMNERGNVLRESPGAAQFGLTQDGRLVHAELVALSERARKQTGVADVEIELSAKGRGEKFWVHARAARFGENYVMLLVDDRTELRRLEETRRDFVANVSHELKTPIGAIGLLAEAIQNATDDPAMVAKFAESMQRESVRLANLVQEVILLSKVQNSGLPESAGAVNLGRVVQDAVERNQLLADQNQIRLAAVADSKIEVFGDYDMLTAAVRNLVENAIVYSNPGDQVGVGLRLSEGYAEISVTDSGIGIPESEHERIFERFYRVDPSRSRETGGTGLGLSIVKHAAQNHRGDIKLFSRVGVGSTFTLRLPAPPAGSDPLTETDTENRPGRATNSANERSQG